MKKLEIESLDELEAMFREKTIEMTDNIKNSIQEAVTAKKRVAQLFEIQMGGVDGSFEISLPKKEWIIALENCLRHHLNVPILHNVLGNSLMLLPIL